MYEIIGLILFLGMFTTLIIIYYQIQGKNLESFLNGTCPSCKETIKEFKTNDGKIVKKNPIIKIVLEKASCSPKQVQYECVSCKYKQIFIEQGNCSI